MTKYIQRKDGEGFVVPVGEIYRLACCDCGLVHDVVFAIEDGQLAMAARRNNHATAKRRSVHGRTCAQCGHGEYMAIHAVPEKGIPDPNPFGIHAFRPKSTKVVRVTTVNQTTQPASAPTASSPPPPPGPKTL